MDAVRGSRAARTQRAVAMDVIAVAAVAAGLMLMGVRIGRGTQSPAELLGVLGMVIAGYVTADLLTGFVHWFCDTFFEETTPIIGPGLIAPFREHHRDPLLMTQHGFLELTGSSFRGLAAVLWTLLSLGPELPVLVTAFIFSAGSAAVVTNLLHRWAHEPDPPLIARLLHASGLVLTPKRHSRHHQPPYAAAYCVTSGWLNPMCERLKIWTRAEALIAALGLPRHRE